MKLKNSNYAIYGICLLWCGVLLGVSFIATPAKFLVAELDIVTAVKIGRATFQVYHYFEIAAACLVFLALCLFRVNRTVWAYFALLGLVLAAQTFLVQPLLTATSEKLFAGIAMQSKSNMHLYYIFCDCLKAALLIGFLPAIAFIDSATYGQGGLKLHPKDSAV
ncbi:MAG: hypothetical protein ACJAQ6_001390 [Arenicella sp.]|jgi:hypothetical protein